MRLKNHSWNCCDRKSPSDMCANLCPAAANNNRVHAP